MILVSPRDKALRRRARTPRNPTGRISPPADGIAALRVLGEQLHERVGGNDGGEEVVDPLERRLGLLRLLGRGRAAHHDREITPVARGARIALDAPVEMNAG